MGSLRNVVTAFKPSNIQRGLDAARNPPDQAAIAAAVASLPPEQRAAYEANMAEVERARAESQASWESARAIADSVQVLRGPAGRYVNGSSMGELPSPQETERMFAERGLLPAIGELRALRRGEFKQGLRQAFGIQEVEQVSDPAERARIAAAERAARTAARAPYRAERPAEVAISRLATRGETQLAEVMAYLHASGLAQRPEQVFGVYRVPDRISGPLTPQSERGRVVEWDVVHGAGAAASVAPTAAGALPDEAAPAPGSASAPLVATAFVGSEHWIARRVGEPSVLDEDVALAYCLLAGIGPERCAGLARMSEFRAIKGGEEDQPLHTLVQGVVALHPEVSGDVFAQMRAEAPIPFALTHPGDAGIHVEVLNWEAIGDAVHLKIHHPPSTPSPYPYLPSTPQELLRSYLEVVGVQPQDCYSAQATVDRPRPLIQGGFFTTNVGPKQPCADGERRMRTHGCEHVVIAYRDTPAYVAGRARWEAYQSEVLLAELRNGTGARRPVSGTGEGDLDDAVPTAALRSIVRAAATVDRWTNWDSWGIGVETIPPHRYCWPPVDAPGPR